MIIAIDFDGTIVDHEFPKVGKEKPFAVSTIRWLQRLGHKIIIWTCREEPYIKPMIDWLREKGIVPDAVNKNIEDNLKFALHKVYADIYIDDRNLYGFHGWLAVKKYFQSLQVFVKKKFI